MLCFTMNSLEKSLLPSSFAPAFEGPTTKTDFRSISLLIKSTIPSIKGISGPTITKLISSFSIEILTCSKFNTSTFKLDAILEVPAFPGATNILLQLLDSLSFQQKACSLAPDPIISTFILQI